ncbi:unnamed protein product, partial [Ectocarpus sp. 12 AP-2014]
LCTVFVLVTAQVASRFIFNFSFAAASEISIYAAIWSVFLGAAVAFRGNRHIAMDFLKNALPNRLQKFLNIFIFLSLALFLAIITLKGYDLSLRAMRQVSPAAGLQVGYVSMAMPVCSVLALVFLIENFVTQLKKAPEND